MYASISESWLWNGTANESCAHRGRRRQGRRRQDNREPPAARLSRFPQDAGARLRRRAPARHACAVSWRHDRDRRPDADRRSDEDHRHARECRAEGERPRRARGTARADPQGAGGHRLHRRRQRRPVHLLPVPRARPVGVVPRRDLDHRALHGRRALLHGQEPRQRHHLLRMGSGHIRAAISTT